MNLIYADPESRLFVKGPYAFRVNMEAAFALEHPDTATTPKVTLRFVSEEQLNSFNRGRRDGSLPFPEDLSPYPEISLRSETVQVPPNAHCTDCVRITFSFQAEAQNGAYLLLVAPDHTLGGEGKKFHLIIANRAPSHFPAEGVEDLAEVIVQHVNLADKNGFLWFANPIFFAENFLLIQLSDEVKHDALSDPNRPSYLPFSEDRLRLITMGYGIGGLERLRLRLTPAEEDDAEREKEETPCFDFEAMRELPRHILRLQ